jgi:monoterpene epsilon-lactone hydrolase
MKNLWVILIVLFSSVNNIFAQPAISDDWIVARTIPFPRHLSPELRQSLKESGQPNVSARKNTTVAHAITFAKNRNIVLAQQAEQLAKELKVSIEESTISGIQVFRVSPEKSNIIFERKIFLHLHGGGYIAGAGLAGTLEAIYIAYHAGISVVSVDYRMPPEHIFPAALDDAIAVYKDILKRFGARNVGIGGTSAGAGLALATLQKAKKMGLEMPAVVFIGTPWADLAATGDTYATNEGIDSKLVSQQGMMQGVAKLYAGPVALDNPSISPVNGDFSQFPPTYLVSGTRDLLLSDTVRVHRKLKNAGAIADLNVYEGMSHADYVFIPGTDENIQVYTDLANFISKYLL